MSCKNNELSYCSLLKQSILFKKTYCRVSSAKKCKLNKCLSTLDLVGYGIAAMVGSSIFILTGSVMRTRAGPATFLAYIIAGIVALPNSLAYAELACKIPKAGSIYIYAYVLLNELVAFFTGWSVLLEYMIGSGAVARGCSGMVDVMSHGSMSALLVQTFGRLNSVSYIFAEYLDPLGALLIVIVGIVSCFGINSSALLNNIMVFFNLIVVFTITIFMFAYADARYFILPAPSNYTPTDKTTNFQIDPSSPNWLPFGISGLIAGAATCFNAFIGFDVISTCAEETKVPSKSLPKANLIAVLLVTTVLSLCALSLALYEPWFVALPSAPFHSALLLSKKGSESARLGMFYFVGCGAIIGLVSSLLGNLIAASRILYGMAEDNLIFPVFHKLCQPFKSPVFATSLVVMVSLFMTMIFSIESLADFLSLGTLIAYSVASIAVLKSRYCDGGNVNPTKGHMITREELQKNSEDSKNEVNVLFLQQFWKDCLPKKLVNLLTPASNNERGYKPMIILFGYILLSIVFIAGSTFKYEGNNVAKIARVSFLTAVAFSMLCSVWLISIHEQTKSFDEDLYEVPFVPWLPCISLLLNMILVSQLTWLTWVRFLIWIAAGAILYLTYGVRHSRNICEEH